MKPAYQSTKDFYRQGNSIFSFLNVYIALKEHSLSVSVLILPFSAHQNISSNAYIYDSQESGSLDLDVTSPKQLNRRLFLKQLAVDLCTSEQRILFRAQYVRI